MYKLSYIYLGQIKDQIEFYNVIPKSKGFLLEINRNI